MDGLCYCNIHLMTDGRISEHALNCPARPKVSIAAAQVLVTPAEAAGPFHSSEWQRGYEAGYAAGLAARKIEPEPING